MNSSTLAMHMSDGIVDAPTSAIFGLIAILGLGYSLRRARLDLDERTAPMAGLVAAFIFAMQMINFPVLPGVSGHLLGGALAAILVGPWLGGLCIGIVLIVQALLFADGGLTALGTNITNMALIGTWTGFAIAILLRRLAIRNRAGLFSVTFAAAFLNTVAASTGFVVEYAIGGTATSALDTVAFSIIGVHCLIGIGEGLLTALTVGAVAAARPDLIYLLRTSSAGRVAVPTGRSTS